ncbi:O-antigen ligase family protein [Enterococcus dongliensis]|uniref:O-antigen ligase family protein n=1 Tax=Enterococcus dongliensis TaxID=2559925 RepID=UPI002890EF4C|nr:O-antigen ligase family protein [Enterococcus dongliensis]MDT2674684.1 O-antigen ligase family protein [Enterococcus dongliensis]
MKNKICIYKISYILIIFYLFFSYIDTKLIIFPLLGTFIVASLAILNNDLNIHLNSDLIIWYCFLLSCFFTLLYSDKKKEAILFIFVFFIFMFLKEMFMNLPEIGNFIVVIFMFFSSIHVIATLAQFFIPNLVIIVNQSILPSDLLNINLFQLKSGRFAGITGQTGANAFFISIFIGTILVKIRESQHLIKSILYIVAMTVAFFCLFLTDKRGMLVFTIISIFLVIMINIYSESKKYFWSIAIISSLIALLLFLVLATLRVIDFSNFKDLSTGRSDLYQVMAKMIDNNVFLGNGFGSVVNTLGIKGHNIYLQLFAEQGIFSVLIFILAVINTFYLSVKSHLLIPKIIDNSKIIFGIYVQSIFILYGLTGNPLYDYFILGVYLLVTGLPLSFLYNRK